MTLVINTAPLVATADRRDPMGPRIAAILREEPGELADLSIVVVAERSATQRLLTFDERHFRALRPLNGGQFTLLPSDAQGR